MSAEAIRHEAHDCTSVRLSRHGATAIVAFALAAPLPVGSAQGGEPFPQTLSVGTIDLAVHAPHRPLVPVEAPADGGLRFDGNSTWAESRGPVSLEVSDGIAIEAWVALASPPVEPAAVLHLDGAEGDLRLSVSPWRQPEFILGDLRAASFDTLPLGEWVHLAATFDGTTARLFVDGEEVGSDAGPAPERLTGILTAARTRNAGLRYDTHRLGIWNGAIAGLSIESGHAERPVPADDPPSPADVSVPDVWFADDRHRPQVHPIPPAGWTNEPHALLHRDGLWHLYHQANPNGGFWEQIVWGHLVSSDLRVWEPRPPALTPSTGFDSHGVWVGNVIPGVSPPTVLYTGVNGERSGLGRAVWQPDGSFTRDGGAIAYDTPRGYQDMRDPWIVETDEGWLALIGSGRRDGTEAVLLAWVSADARRWTFAGEFDTGGVAMPGEYWELPVLLPIGERWLLMGTPVVRDAKTRTIYWTGDFDGGRFIPDHDEPLSYDLFRTLLSPTLASDAEGRLVAIGIVADDGQRPEEDRARAGWVHTLSLPYAVTLCPDDDGRLCHAIAWQADAHPAPETVAAGTGLDDEAFRLDLGAAPQRLVAEIQVAEGAVAEIGLRAAADGSEVTRLLLKPAEGLVALDNTDGSQAPWARDDIIWGEIPRAETARIDIVVDGGAIGGTINDRPFGFLVYPEGDDTYHFTLRGEGEVTLVHLATVPLR